MPTQYITLHSTVVCADNITADDHLTLGKTYQVVDLRGVQLPNLILMQVKLLDDKDQQNWFDANRFCVKDRYG